MAAAQAPRRDVSRLGGVNFSRQADLMLVAGRVSHKMAPVLRQFYDHMLAPRWVIAVGDCAACGGVFNNYAVVQGVDEVLPVDVYVAGCPPHPEALAHGIVQLQDKIKGERLTTWK
jgi:NADH-quinone oxidoreductase subunit B